MPQWALSTRVRPDGKPARAGCVPDGTESSRRAATSARTSGADRPALPVRDLARADQPALVGPDELIAVGGGDRDGGAGQEREVRDGSRAVPGHLHPQRDHEVARPGAGSADARRAPAGGGGDDLVRAGLLDRPHPPRRAGRVDPPVVLGGALVAQQRGEAQQVADGGVVLRWTSMIVHVYIICLVYGSTLRGNGNAAAVATPAGRSSRTPGQSPASVRNNNKV